MASSYKLRRQAEEDITAILNYIAVADPNAAINLYTKLSHLFDLLAQFPDMGCKRTELMPEMSSIPLGNYVIFFEAKEELEIIRVLHGARDIQKDLF